MAFSRLARMASLMLAVAAGRVGAQRTTEPPGVSQQHRPLVEAALGNPPAAAPWQIFDGAFFTLGLFGRGFSRDATVLVNGQPRKSVVRSESRIDCDLLFPESQPGQPIRVQVMNGAPGFAASNELAVQLQSPALDQINLSDIYAFVGSAGMTVTIYGEGIVQTTRVLVDEQPRESRCVVGRFSATLEVMLSAADLDRTRMHRIRVFNPPPGGGYSQPAFFEVRPRELGDNLLPSLSIGKAVEFSYRDVYFIDGYGFSPKASVSWNGAPLANPAFRSIAQIGVLLDEEVTRQPGLIPVTVTNPTGTSNVSLWTVPLPALPSQEWAYSGRTGAVYFWGESNRLTEMNARTGAMRTMLNLPIPGTLTIADGSATLFVGTPLAGTYEVDLEQNRVVAQYPVACGLPFAIAGDDAHIACRTDGITIIGAGIVRPQTAVLPIGTDVIGTTDTQIIASQVSRLETARDLGCVWVAEIGAAGIAPFEYECLGSPRSSRVKQLNGLLFVMGKTSAFPIGFEPADAFVSSAALFGYSLLLDAVERRIYVAFHRASADYLQLQVWDMDTEAMLETIAVPMLPLGKAGPGRLVRSGPREFLFDARSDRGWRIYRAPLDAAASVQ
jgi:hypothetical protein